MASDSSSDSGDQERSSLKITVKRTRVELDPSVDVFNVIVEGRDERRATTFFSRSYGSEAEIRAFLDGVQAGLSFSDKVYMPPEIPQEADQSLSADSPRFAKEGVDRMPFHKGSGG